MMEGAVEDEVGDGLGCGMRDDVIGNDG